MNTIQIKHRYSDTVLYSGVHATIAAATIAANLRGANLRGANLSGALNLTESEGWDVVYTESRILPDEGEIIGFKKVWAEDSDGDKCVPAIAKLRIPGTAKRSHAFGRKCRASEAEVLELVTLDGQAVEVAYSSHDYSFEYKPGETVRPQYEFDTEWMDECRSGIHFFITRKEAENY